MKTNLRRPGPQPDSFADWRLYNLVVSLRHSEELLPVVASTM
jgi:hypothetical protein